jgi:hypothetical protein
MSDVDHAMSEEQRKEASRIANQQNAVAKPTQEAAQQNAVEATRAETRSLTQTVDLQQAKAADQENEQDEAADSLWDEARDQDREDLADAWDQVSPDQEQQLKDAFNDVAERADAARQALIDQSADAGGRGAVSEQLSAIDEEMSGARRDVAQALDAAAQGNDKAVDDALQSLEARANEVAKQEPESDRLFAPGDIAEAERRLDVGEFRAQGQGLRELRLNLDIDEPKSIVNGGAWDDPANKQFSERMTNQVTKGGLEEQREPPELPVISLREAREQGAEAFKQAALGMLDRRFSETEELKAVTAEARGAMTNLDRDDRTLANALNNAIRDRIESASTEAAKLVAEALQVADVELRRRREAKA